jgi:hypothetical protein
MAGGRFTGIAIQQAQLTPSGKADPQTRSPQPDREDVRSLSDFEIINRLNMQMRAKPIPSDAAHTSGQARPIPTLPVRSSSLFHPFKI